ncbi:MAG: hypothetical protein ACRD3E_07510 [Terriglobales bacterium]
MHENTRFRLEEYGLLIVWTIVFLAAVPAILYVPFRYYEGWAVLGVIAAEIAVIIVFVHLYRWNRYPGIAQSHSRATLFRNVLVSILLIWALPIWALLAKIHLLRLVPFRRLAVRYGLEFEHTKRETAQVSRVAPEECRPGEIGRVISVRVATENEFNASAAEPAGTVFYTLRFADGQRLEIPEREIIPAD